MREGILGGSFDPVHLGHVALAEAAVREACLDRIIIMPAGIQPFKQDAHVTDSRHRLAMLRIAFKDVEKAEVSDYELRHGGVSYTYDTLTSISLRDGQKAFFVVGTDSFLQLESWYRGEELLKSFSFIVSSRPGYKEEELKEAVSRYKKRYGTGTVRLKSQMPPVSSTDVRKRLAEGLDVSDMTPPGVAEYIRENGLYR